MNDDQREAIRSNAKYLRQVRPVDPEEIYEYVEGEPHPADVQQVLREEAVELGLRERADGTFVPASNDPIDVTFHGVDALPERHTKRLEERLVAELGAGWPESDAGERLRSRIRDVKERYLVGSHVEYDARTALGYAIYHLSSYYAAAQYVLADLAADDRIPGTLRVVDVGAGVGGPALGLVDLLPDDALLEYHAVEPSAAADVLRGMLADTGPNVHVTIHEETAEAFDIETLAGEDGVDLCLFANVLSELDEPATVARRYFDSLADVGTMVAIAPADRNTAIGLRAVERSLADDGPATVYGPTLRLWPGMAPAGECWSFDVKPDLDVPPFQERLDAAADDPEHEPGEFHNVDVQYAFSILTPDGERAHDVRARRERYARMADAEDLVTERVDLMAVKLSHDLADGGNPLYLIGDGSEQVDHFAVVTESSVLNEDLRTAEYGAVLHVENALVLWNDDEGAYNVVVNGETVVDRIAG